VLAARQARMRKEGNVEDTSVRVEASPPGEAQEIEHGEIDRVRAEYRRRARDLPPGFYGLDRPANYFWHARLCAQAIHDLAGEGLFPLTGRRVLDTGCGQGVWLLEFCQWGATPDGVAGIDLSPERIGEARLRLPAADLRAGDARELPWPDASFDLVTQFTLFTSILQETVRRKIAREMLRVLRPGGALLWYDFRYDNPRNPHVRGIEAAEIGTLFPDCRVRLRKTTLAPPIARAVAPRSWIAAICLEKIPPLRTHYLGVIRKAGEQTEYPRRQPSGDGRTPGSSFPPWPPRSPRGRQQRNHS
jgi:SAM-dependent methyltransferase